MGTVSSASSLLVMKKQWVFDVDDVTHTVDVELNMLNGSRTLQLDGEAILSVPGAMFDMTRFLCGTHIHSFLVEGHPSELHVDYDNVWPALRIYVDGFAPEDGAAPMKPRPRWAWFYIVLCLLVALFFRGTLLALSIALSGTLGVRVVARLDRRDEKTRMMFCMGIVAICWVFMAVYCSANRKSCAMW
eukprot:TRINITY_DN31758_c0_g1_i2.p1 TRINITY_DN31758_c0_g1~~TRINITY_DN31758_c0_g1_i2.p1  ORF type:complete len:197 (+),score=40.17 TRINITY_DN31758_c0_g1_i2:29-592(+)